MKTKNSVLSFTYDQVLEELSPIHDIQAKELISELVCHELELMFDDFFLNLHQYLEGTFFAKEFYKPEDFICYGEEGIILNKSISLELETVVKIVSNFLSNKNDKNSKTLIKKTKYIQDLLCRGYSYEMFGTTEDIVLDALPNKEYFYAPNPYEDWIGDTELKPLVDLLRMPINIQTNFYLEESERLWIEAALDYITFPTRNEINRYGYTNKTFLIENGIDYINFCVFYIDLDMNFWGMPTSCLLGNTPPVFHLIDRKDLINVHEAIALWLEQCSKDLSEIVNFFIQKLNEEIQEIDLKVKNQFNNVIYLNNFIDNHNLIFVYDIEDDKIIEVIDVN